MKITKPQNFRHSQLVELPSVARLLGTRLKRNERAEHLEFKDQRKVKKTQTHLLNLQPG
jgi:hypothetical protein